MNTILIWWVISGFCHFSFVMSANKEKKVLLLWWQILYFCMLRWQNCFRDSLCLEGPSFLCRRWIQKDNTVNTTKNKNKKVPPQVTFNFMFQPQRAQNSAVHLFAAFWLSPLSKFVLNVHTFLCHFFGWFHPVQHCFCSDFIL